MKILAVTPWFPTPEKPESGIFNVRDVELISQENNVSVVHVHDPQHGPTPKDWVTDFGVEVQVIEFSTAKPATWLSAAKYLRKRIKNVDLVHSMAISAMLPVWLARPKKTPWVHTEHWSGLVAEVSGLRPKIGRALLSRFFKKPDRVIAVSDELAEVIDQSRKSAEQKTVVIGNHVSFDEGSRVAAEIPKNGAVKLVSVGGLIERKGPLETIAAVKLLIEEGIAATLTWAGNGPLLEQSLKLAEKLGVENRVNLMGQVDPPELNEILLESHIFVSPTSAETFGVALAEALARGLPVVTSGTGGHVGFMPKNGSLFVDRTPRGIADGIKAMISGQKIMKSNEIFDYAQSIFSESARKKAYTDVYSSVTCSI